MEQITVSELKNKLDQGVQLHLIDVREPHENEEFNIGGINIPVAELSQHGEQLQGLAAEAPLVLYCRSGNRSGMAQKILALHFGINNTLNVTGGMLAWTELNGE